MKVTNTLSPPPPQVFPPHTLSLTEILLREDPGKVGLVEADGQEEGLVAVVGVVPEKVDGVVSDGRVLQLAC